MKTATTIIALTLAVASVAFSEPASAGDLKSFSTMVCRPNGPAALDVITYSHQGVFNTSTTNNAVVICPLTNDTESSIAADDATLGFFMRAPGSGSASVNCTVQVGSLSSGSFSASASTGTIAAGGVGSATLPVQHESAFWVWEPINLVCSLSPRARLTRIYVDQDTATDSPVL